MPKIFKILDKFKIVYDVTDKILMTICKLLLIADILIATLTVIQRYVPNAIFPPMPWGEQMVLTFMVYMAVLSAALAIRRGSHIRMTAFDKYFPKTLVKISDLISDLIVLALSASSLPLPNLACSLLTVLLSGQIIGLIQRIPAKA